MKIVLITITLFIVGFLVLFLIQPGHKQDYNNFNSNCGPLAMCVPASHKSWFGGAELLFHLGSIQQIEGSNTLVIQSNNVTVSLEILWGQLIVMAAVTPLFYLSYTLSKAGEKWWAYGCGLAAIILTLWSIYIGYLIITT